MNFLVYIVLGAGLVFFGGLAVTAFCWAVKDGQFRDLDQASRCIFDEDEPVGAATDVFADKRAAVSLRRKFAGRSLT